jgi:hypothetical protein
MEITFDMDYAATLAGRRPQGKYSEDRRNGQQFVEAGIITLTRSFPFSADQLRRASFEPGILSKYCRCL